ncbi:MAG TPA: tetratricopeptide repeat protein [Kribbellaceae bacterium]|nr:tetratricopeptide repeat protein [Kribbellaceae bacterium]
MPPAGEPVGTPVETFTVPPDPGRAGTLTELVEQLRLLKVWAGDPSYECVTGRVNAAWTAAGRPAGELARKTTVVDCFRRGRRRLNTDLVVAVVQALHPDVGYVTQWRQALQMIGGEIQAASHVRVQNTLPQDLAEFTGRTTELDRLRQALRRQDGNAVMVSAIEGMPGVGKTQLAVHAAHLLVRENPFEQVLFVNLRGFHPDPAQPPADPAAVLDGFLRMLGVPGSTIPHDLPGRAAAYRQRLSGSHTLVLLDNAASEDQVHPLLPQTPGCITLVTSRRGLTDLPSAVHLALDVFTADEALAFLAQSVPGVPIGQDPDAPARIAQRCGYLPLALGLVAGRIRGKPGWTLTDHAERLDERHDGRRLEAGVELAFHVSYQHLPAEQQRMLRLAALHPGQDFDAYAATALTGTDLPTARTALRRLRDDYLLQQTGPGRYTLHDLVQAYAASQAGDDDPPPERHAALTRLFDHYLATVAAAMDTLYPAEAHRRPRIAPSASPTPPLTDPDSALTWLDVERPTLVAVAAYTATHGWPAHTTRLSTTLFRYLDGGYSTEALTIHGHALPAAQHSGHLTGQAQALTNLATALMQLSRFEPAGEHLRQALTLLRQTGDRAGQARASGNLGVVEQRLGHYRSAARYHKRALTQHRQSGDRTGEARALYNLGVLQGRLGRHHKAVGHYEQVLALCRQAGDGGGEATALNCLGDVEVKLSRYELATEHFEQALTQFRRYGDRVGQAGTLDSLGTLHTHLGQPTRAAEYHHQALCLFQEIGDRDGEAWALNGLGEAAHTAGHATDALNHHTDAHAIATDIGALDQQARANAGLGHAHRILGNHTDARRHYQRALTLYAELGMPQAEQIRAHLTAVDGGGDVDLTVFPA